MGLSLTGKAGLLLAGTGVAHFIAPELFTVITKTAFPQDTETWVFRNGACETAIGSAMVLPPTRRLGVLALLGYGGWLGYNASTASGQSNAPAAG